jgi:RHS repeat-associated protein
VPDYILKSGIAYRIVTDQLGSIRQVINSTTGQIIQQMDYDEYGSVTNSSGQQIVPMGFAGGIYDAQTGLTRFGARDYEAMSGRWITSDKARFKGGQTNFFVYSSNDPINQEDPTGMSAELYGVQMALGSAATLWATGEFINAIISGNVLQIGLKMLAFETAASDAQDAANNLAMEAMGASGNSNLIGLAFRQLGLSKTEADYAKAALYIWNCTNIALFEGGLTRRITDGGLLGLDVLELGKNELQYVLTKILGPFVIRPDYDPQ